MAVTFSDNPTRGSVYYFDPADVVIKAELNGRHVAPDLTDLKNSLLANGQLQPVIIRREQVNDKTKAVLVAGFSRWQAISELNKTRKPGDRIKIACVFTQQNEVDAYISNWDENRARNATQPMDDAHQFAQLRKWGKTDKEIAQRCRVSESAVKQGLLLMEAAPEVQKAVENGRIKPTAAAKIAKLAAEQQRAAVKGEGRVSAADVRKATGKGEKWTPRQIREYLETSADDTTGDPKVRAFCLSMLIKAGIREKGKAAA